VLRATSATAIAQTILMNFLDFTPLETLGEKEFESVFEVFSTHARL